MEEAGISASLFRVHQCMGGKEIFVAGSEVRVPRLRHGRDWIESGLSLHLSRTRFEAARAAPLSRTCLLARPPEIKESSCHWDALDNVSKRDCSPHQVHGAAVEAGAGGPRICRAMSGWSCHATGVEQQIAAGAGRKAALRLGGVARIIVEVPGMR